MGSESAAQALEALAEALVFAEPSDLQTLEALRERCVELTRTELPGGAGEIASRMAELVSRLCRKEVDDPAGGLEVLSKGVSALQALVLGAARTEEVTPPEGLPTPPAPSPPSPPAPAAAGAEPKDRPSRPPAQDPPQVNLAEDADLLSSFVAEAEERLSEAEANLLTVEADPADQEAISGTLRALHTLKGASGFLQLDDIAELTHEVESLLQEARRASEPLSSSSCDLAFEAVDAIRTMVNGVRGYLGTGRRTPPPATLPDLLSRVRMAQEPSEEDETAEESPQAVVLPPTSRTEPIEPLSMDSAPGAGAAPEVAATVPSPRVMEVVRVDAYRLDRLIDAIGELVIAESMVRQSVHDMAGGSPQLERQLAQLDRITHDLHEAGSSLRMISVQPTFQRMVRLVRDLSRRSRKPVEIALSGQDTEIDKALVDRLSDPLVHLVRNAVDHGLETTPEERQQRGKSGTGHVELRAYHKGSSIYIEVEDDGRGIDREKVLAKARSRGLVEEGQQLSDREVHNLLFESGFSSASQVTDVSGRGVGLDVVKRSIDAMRGHVEVHSVPGRGTRFTLRLPLTLAVIDGMVVRVGSERYIIPTLAILRSVQPRAQNLVKVVGRGLLLNLSDESIPVFKLSELFSIPMAQTDPTRGLVVIVEDEERHAGLLCDELLGQRQIVIKSLEETMRSPPGTAGAAIMPDGRVGLIIDVSQLVRLAHGAPETRSGVSQSPTPTRA